MTNNASAHGATASKTIVIKLGTSSILSESTHQPKLSILSSLVETCHALRTAGHRVVLVCSGAIGMGKVRMGFMGQSKGVVPSSSLNIGERQALAALGQLRLIALWDTLFGELGIRVAQVLFTRNDIADRPRFVNARNTLQTLLSPRFNAIPIVNENDTVSISELRFGDNDTLSAITAGLIDADYLFLLTDVDGLYTGNPRNDPNARRLGIVDNVAKARKLVNVASQGSNFGTGGMMTKLIAAELATAAGVATVIINGSNPSNIVKVVEQSHSSTSDPASSKAGHDDDDASHHPLMSSVSSLDMEKEKDGLLSMPPLDDPPHTLFLPVRNPLKSRKWGILHAIHPAGTIIIDEGAFKRVSRPESGGRLLAAGVVGVEGTWERMQAVRLMVRRKRSATVSLASEQMPVDVITINDITSSTGSGTVTPASSSATPDLVKRLNTYLRTSHSASPNSFDHGKEGESSAHKEAGGPVAEADGLAIHDRNGSSAADHAAASQHPMQSCEEWELAEIGRGLANYSSIECERIKGLNSSQIIDVLGYSESDYVVDEMALRVHPQDSLR